MKDKLTEKQKKFCEFYVASGNATESAIKAGYSEKTAYSIGNENLKKPDVKLYIDDLNKEIKSQRIANITEIQETLTSIMRGETKEEVIVSEMVGDGRSITKTVLKQASVKDRLKAGELLGKAKMMFTDKLQVEKLTPVKIVGEEDLEE